MLGVAVLIFGIVQIAVFDSDERFCARGSTAFYYGTLPLVVCEITFNLLIFTTILLIWCEHCFKHHANVDGMYFDYCGLLALLRTPRLVRRNQRTGTTKASVCAEQKQSSHVVTPPFAVASDGRRKNWFVPARPENRYETKALRCCTDAKPLTAIFSCCCFRQKTRKRALSPGRRKKRYETDTRIA